MTSYDETRAEILSELRREQAIADEYRAAEADAANRRTRRTDTGGIVIEERESKEDVDTLAELWDRHDGRTVEGDHVPKRITRHRDGRVSLEP